MQEKILLTKRESIKIIKEHTKRDPEIVRRENFYYRYGEFFEYGNIKINYKQWKAKGGSVRRIIESYRLRRIRTT